MALGKGTFYAELDTLHFDISGDSSLSSRSQILDSTYSIILSQHKHGDAGEMPES